MPEREVEPTIEATVAFRPAGAEVHDRMFVEHARGMVDEIASDSELPGRIPPPAPTGPVPTESLADRLQTRLGLG